MPKGIFLELKQQTQPTWKRSEPNPQPLWAVGKKVPVLLNAVFIADNPLDNFSFMNENVGMHEIRHYLTTEGKDPVLEWLKQLRDPIAKIQIVKRINRLEQDNFGDHRFCREGVWELRVNTGAGYRLYYAQAGLQIILLLCGGDKRTQDADIDRAVRFWQDWQRRSNDER